MVSIAEVALLIFIPIIILVAIYAVGRKSKRKTGREPFASGHKFPHAFIPYRPWWLYYIAFFILWDIIVVFILFMASEVSIYVITSLIILLITILAYPLRP